MLSLSKFPHSLSGVTTLVRSFPGGTFWEQQNKLFRAQINNVHLIKHLKPVKAVFSAINLENGGEKEGMKTFARLALKKSAPDGTFSSWVTALFMLFSTYHH